MTAKEMAHWERWHRLGRPKFCAGITLAAFLAGVATLVCFHFIRGETTHPMDKLGLALAFSLVFFFHARMQWDRRTQEYLRQRAARPAHPQGAD